LSNDFSKAPDVARVARPTAIELPKPSIGMRLSPSQNHLILERSISHMPASWNQTFAGLLSPSLLEQKAWVGPLPPLAHGQLYEILTSGTFGPGCNNAAYNDRMKPFSLHLQSSAANALIKLIPIHVCFGKWLSSCEFPLRASRNLSTATNSQVPSDAPIVRLYEPRS
jgi:hypothetical protein